MSRIKWMLSLDGFLFILFVLLYSPLITALSLHEFLGIIFILPFIIHLLFSWLWIKQSTKRLLKTINWRYKLNYLLNLTLFVLVILEIVSGLIISQVLLPSIGIKTINDWRWRALHNQVSVGIVIIVSFHISMNWQRIISYFKIQIPLASKITKNKVSVSRIIARELKRSLVIVFVAVIITILCLPIVGTPEKEKVNLVNDIVRLKQNTISGSVQLTGTVITIVILVYIAYKWLKIRL